MSAKPDLAALLDRAYEQKLRAGAAFHALQASRSVSRRRLAALAIEFRGVAELLELASALLSEQRAEGTRHSD